MDEDTLRLAALLLSYECDEPHVNLPDLQVGLEVDQHYPVITTQQVRDMLDSPHAGDCIKMPAPCVRCIAEMLVHKATWLRAKGVTFPD